MTIQSAAYNRALDFLNTFLQRHAGAAQRLPRTRDLAAQAGVSTVAMCQALRAMKDKGLVSVRKRRGIEAGTSIAEQTVRREPRWRLLQHQIEQQIAEGRFPGVDLPSLAELTHRYGGSYATIRKAVDALVDARALVMRGRSYRITRARSPTSYASVLFISRSDDSGRTAVFSDRLAEYLTTLELERANNGLRFVLLAFSNAGAEKGLADLHAVRKDGNFIASIIWTNGIPYETIDRLLERLAPERKPVVLLDETGDYVLPRQFGMSGFIKIFTLAAQLAGEQIGRYLYSLGHRQVAFVSPYGNLQWAIDRYQGLARVYSQDNAIEFHGIDAEHAEVAISSQKKSLLHRLSIAVDAMMEKNVRNFLLVGGTSIALPTLTSLEKFDSVLGEIFTRLVRKKQITAWVGANDVTAMLAIDFLRRNHKRVGRDVSVVGFDDSRVGFQYELTSYNFALPHIARKTIAFILNPKYPPVRHLVRIECEGTIMERPSTGKTAQ